MVNIEALKMYAEIVDDVVIVYDYIEYTNEIDYNSEGKLTEISEEHADCLCQNLLIKNLDDFDVKIVKDDTINYKNEG